MSNRSNKFWGISELEVLTVNSDHREQKTISK